MRVILYAATGVLAAFFAGLIVGLMHRVAPPPVQPKPLTCAQIEAKHKAETCVAWWFGSQPGELANTRKRICGRK